MEEKRVREKKKKRERKCIVHYFDLLPKSSRSKTAERGGALIRLWIK